jgi:Fe-S oxidoreductase
VSCKACASECPSNVDVAALKSEFYTTKRPMVFAANFFANNAKLSWYFSSTDYFMVNQPLVKKGMGVAQKRSAFIGSKTFRNGLKLTNQNGTTSFVNGKVVLFCDEFTNYYDVSVGIDA